MRRRESDEGRVSGPRRSQPALAPGFEAVTDAAKGFQIARMSRVRFDFFTQATHENVDRSRSNERALFPDGIKQLIEQYVFFYVHLLVQFLLIYFVQLVFVGINNDIHRNLQVPLEGVAETARRMGQPLPAIEVAVRTGDTPTAERQRLLRRPPHVLITTPESLHLLLTSRARETLRT